MSADFDEIQFPTRISEGATGGPKFNTRVVTTGAGFEARNQNWSRPLGSYNAGTGVKSRTDFDEVLTFFWNRAGRARGFRFKDWSDYTVGISDPSLSLIVDAPQSFATGDGATKVFQLTKTYVDDVRTTTRTIKKPVSGTVRIWFGSTEQLTGWTVATATGLVTFTAAPANAADIKWGGQFDVPCRFDTDLLSPTLRTGNVREWSNITIVEVPIA